MRLEEILQMIRALKLERDRINTVIAQLEALGFAGPLRRERRGRKSMSADERAEVSRRIKAYWARRRKVE